MTKWLVGKPAPFSAGARDVERIEYMIPERPLLHACCANDTFGDVRLDIRPEVNPDVVADISQRIPFPDDYFGAAFADFPWKNNFKRKIARAMHELLRVAPVVYTMSPWTYGSAELQEPTLWWAWRPGVNIPLFFVRYERKPVSA